MAVVTPSIRVFLCFFYCGDRSNDNNNNNPIPILCYPYPIHTLSLYHPIPIPPYPYTMRPAGPRLQGGTDDFFISHWEAVQFFCQCWLLGPKQKQRINWKLMENPNQALSAPGHKPRRNFLRGSELARSNLPHLLLASG